MSTDDPHDIDAIAGAVAQRILSATATAEPQPCC
jgi:hypothetical protein